jgi:N-acetylglutamate synthase-like GNAT family acetyltransferase
LLKGVSSYTGGYIFSLVSEGEVLGVCALFSEGSGTYELARMAVKPQHQGKGFGNALISACLAKLSEIGASKVYLVSNTKLESAIALYKKYGFKTVHEGQHPVYSRANIVMERHVS